MSITIKDSKSEPQGNPLSVLNERFHAGYQAAKCRSIDDIKRGSILLFVRMDSRLFTMCGKDVQEHLINGEKYHSLKAAVHCTLAAFYTLTQADLNNAIVEVRGWVDTLLNESWHQSFPDIAAATDELLNDVETTGALRYSALANYSKRLESVFAKIMMAAADDEISQLVKILDQAYRRCDKESCNIFLVVIGGHQPRYRELSKLVFTKWFNALDGHIVNADHHVRYIEGGESLDDAIELIAAAITDSDLAKLFMGSSDALNQDALGVIAQKAIARFWADREVSLETKVK